MIEVAIIMAGGRGSRFGSPAKLTIKVCGESLLSRAIRLGNSTARLVIVATSPYTLDLVRRHGLPPSASAVETPGAGFPEDLGLLLRTVRPRPLLVLPADVLGLSERGLRSFVEKAAKLPEPVVTAMSGGEPIGVGLFKGPELEPWTSVELRERVINVNTEADLNLARSLC